MGDGNYGSNSLLSIHWDHHFSMEKSMNHVVNPAKTLKRALSDGQLDTPLMVSLGLPHHWWLVVHKSCHTLRNFAGIELTKNCCKHSWELPEVNGCRLHVKIIDIIGASHSLKPYLIDEKPIVIPFSQAKNHMIPSSSHSPIEIQYHLVMINSSPWKIPKINGSLYIAGKIIDINGPSIPWRTVSHNQRVIPIWGILMGSMLPYRAYHNPMRITLIYPNIPHIEHTNDPKHWWKSH